MKKIILILIAGWAVVSCETVVEVDIPADPPKLTITSFLDPDSVFKIRVGASAPILSSAPALLYQPTVRLTDEDGVGITLINDGTEILPGRNSSGNPAFWVFRATLRPQANKNYRVEVSALRHESVFAVAVAPTPVKITSARLDSANIIIGSANERIIPVEVTFRDPIGPGDHYFPRILAVRRETHVFGGDTTVLVRESLMSLSNDTEVLDLGDHLIALDDGSFDGDVFTLRGYIMIYPDRFRTIGDGWGYSETRLLSLKLYLSHSDEEYFKYFRSLGLQAGASGNPFAQPVQVYSNVVGGLGIFAGLTSSTWVFKE